MAKGKAEKKDTPKGIPNDYKMLQELKQIKKLLKEIRVILDNIWREKIPQ